MIDAAHDPTDPQHVTDAAGNPVAMPPDLDRCHALPEAFDELDAIRAFDEAKADGGEAIPLGQALRETDQERPSR